MKMKVLGLSKGNIIILEPGEIEAKAYGFKQFYEEKGTYGDREKNIYERLLKEPNPYKLFRYNELTGYKIRDLGVEISEEEFMDRLNVLPPVPFKNDIYEGYIVPECFTEDVYEHIFKYKGKYYCVIAREGLKPTIFGTETNKVEKLIDLFLEAENKIRDNKFDEAGELKTEFSKEITKLTEEEQREVYEYLESVGA